MAVVIVRSTVLILANLVIHVSASLTPNTVAQLLSQAVGSRIAPFRSPVLQHCRALSSAVE